MVITNTINLGQLWNKPYNEWWKVYRNIKKVIDDKDLKKTTKMKTNC